ncbi:class D sortase [Bacilliculturomica massiliensis]|uniref:class D sortase n=1 Tax=Bacilliculturomica massiliensis TaxID=1917867 RepID=UPI001030188D|nr:class D sortase [Bacilliculturomica massiliensis]
MKKLSALLILFGLVLIAVPLAGRGFTYLEQQRLLREYQAGLDESEGGPSIMDEAFQDQVADVPDLTGAGIDGPGEGVSDPASGTDKKIPAAVIGSIRIPSIKSDLLLLEGSSARELRYGAGHVTGTAMPGTAGNCAVAGHRNYTFGTYFSRLDEVAPGDEIIAEYEGRTYTYIAAESFLVLPTDTWVLDAPEDGEEKQITLITCAPKGSNTHRLIVRGTLAGVETEE